jgi:DNA-directed RNA polymerase subunit RPC12/RpoP
MKILEMLLFWKRNHNYYRCSKCGYVFPKKEAKVSGFENHPYGLHIHCPKCGHIVDQYVKDEEG